jgi:hypothetical protein
MLIRCILLLLCIIQHINAMQLYTTMNIPRCMTIRSSRTGLICSAASAPQEHPKNPRYLKLDTGMRISRIVTVTTTSFNAMLKLRVATTRREIMKICLVRHRKTCKLSEHINLPTSVTGTHSGWAYLPRQHSSMYANAGTPSAVLWVVEWFNIPHISVGSWILASLPTEDPNHLTALFSHSISRVCPEPQAVSLIRPGFAITDLVHTEDGLHWIMTFIELQHCDELGCPVKRRVSN